MHESPDRPAAGPYTHDGLSPAPDGGPCRLATGDELLRIVTQWSGGSREFPVGASIALVFEAVVARAPDAVAIVTEDGERLTYAALNERANRVAHHLHARGVQPGAIVGVFVERSAMLVAGILGILKAGAAYLPMDLSYPRERTAFILRDAGAALVLTSTAAHGALDPEAAPHVLLDADWPVIARQPVENPAAHATPDSLAYVIFTSGSTGTPKGCEVTQAAVLRLFAACERWFGFGPDDAVAQFHSCAFDVSVFEIFGALLHGARLVLLSSETCRLPDRLLARIVAERVTVLCQTPSAFKQLSQVACRAPEVPPHHLRRLVLAGEALELQTLRPWVDRFGDDAPHLLNMYGPTETTVYVSYRRIRAADITARRGSLIGVPLPDTSFFILDARQQVCAPGEAGELFVGGAGLARGYLRRPELTAERFVWCVPGGIGGVVRLYRTGDLARWTADGEVEYLGRIDAQVKLRGYRIELGEIEARLSAHRGVAACAVIAQQRAGREPRLVAYYVPADAAPQAAELRAHLMRSLPEYMVPSALVMLDALPMNANGKLDRAALPSPVMARPDGPTPYAAPVGALESACCDVFAEYLQLDRVGRDDNFFDAGGDSLLAVQAATALEVALGRPVPVATLFTHASAAALVESLAAPTPVRHRESAAQEPIAIIGMAARLPGADSVEAFWELLDAGRDAVTLFSADELDATIPASVRQDPTYVRARSILDDPAAFDAAFFGMSEQDAALVDPQQRLLLELAWESLERAGYAPLHTTALGQSVGVFAGVYSSDYARLHVHAHPDLVARVGAFQVMLATDKDYVATRIAHRLNLTGPAVSVHTACSTSLVAIVQAVDSLRAGHCTMALAGGAAITLPNRGGHLYVEGGMLSRDGRTRPFDAEATGTVFGDGGALVVLKRLSDALADGDVIHAVIRGVAINNDGGRKASFTAPSVDGQAAVVAAAQRDAGVLPREVSYVEAHGTATPLGDPVEVLALTRAFRDAERGTADVGFCRLGSVKSNVGHMVTAAGAVGVIKTALALEHEMLPGTLHFAVPNPRIDFAASPFVVTAARTAWPRGERPRHAGVSSFGVGGTNAHVVLSEAPRRPDSARRDGPHIFRLSARTATALRAGRTALAAYLATHGDVDAGDVAATLRTGREGFVHRLCVVAWSVADAVQLLRSDATQPLLAIMSEHDERVANAVHIAERWLAGEDLDPTPLSGHRRVVLPTVHFERRRCWLDAAPASAVVRVASPPPEPVASFPDGAAPVSLTEWTIQQQLLVMREQLEVLQRVSGAPLELDATTALDRTA